MPQMMIEVRQGAGQFTLDGFEGKSGYFGDLMIGHRVQTDRQKYLAAQFGHH